LFPNKKYTKQTQKTNLLESLAETPKELILRVALIVMIADIIKIARVIKDWMFGIFV